MNKREINILNLIFFHPFCIDSYNFLMYSTSICLTPFLTHFVIYILYNLFSLNTIWVNRLKIYSTRLKSSDLLDHLSIAILLFSNYFVKAEFYCSMIKLVYTV